MKCHSIQYYAHIKTKKSTQITPFAWEQIRLCLNYLVDWRLSTLDLKCTEWNTCSSIGMNINFLKMFSFTNCCFHYGTFCNGLYNTERCLQCFFILLTNGVEITTTLQYTQSYRFTTVCTNVQANITQYISAWWCLSHIAWMLIDC